LTNNKEIYNWILINIYYVFPPFVLKIYYIVLYMSCSVDTPFNAYGQLKSTERVPTCRDTLWCGRHNRRGCGCDGGENWDNRRDWDDGRQDWVDDHKDDSKFLRERVETLERKVCELERRCHPRGQNGCGGREYSKGFAEFYASMPGDNSSTIAVGAPVTFPQNGSNSGIVVRDTAGVSTTSFVLREPGTYRVTFNASVTEAGQLLLGLDSGSGVMELLYSIFGRATGTSQIVGDALVTTTTRDSKLSVRNPLGNSTALTLTTNAGGTRASVATLIIEKLC
jgi:hypothetical protein